jgi:peptidylprolyl isomerase
MSTANKGDQVKIHYSGKTENGEEFASTYGEESLTIEIGKGDIWEAIENGLVGMSPGESKTVNIAKEEGIPYTEELIFDIPKTALPEDMEPEIGTVLQLQDPGGQVILAKVLEIKDEVIAIDSNHPLAGQNLTFTFELVEIC